MQTSRPRRRHKNGLANVITPQRSQGALRRRQIRLRILLVACALVFAAGVVAIVQATTSEGPAPTVAPRSQTKAPTQPDVKPGGKLTAEEQRVASRFVVTALGRQHLAEAWTLATSELRNAVTYKQWLAGEMPIPPFPVNNLKATGYQVVASAPNKILLQVLLVPKPGTEYQATRYDMTLVRRGGKWKVSYLVPYAPPGIFSPNNS
jgi:hypothetical protein